MLDDKQLHDLLVANESQIMNSLANAQPERDQQTRRELMDANVLFLNGFVGKMSGEALQDTFNHVQITSWEIPESHLIRLNENTGVLTFYLKQQGSLHGHALPTESYSTSVWRKRNHQWQVIFHQETIKKQSGEAH